MKTKIRNINKVLVKQFGIPIRNTELPDSVDMIIATILSQNTNDRNSYKAFLNLKTKYKERWYWTDTSPELTEESVDPVRLPPAHRSYIRAIRDRMPDISDQDLRDKLLELDTKLKKKSRSILSAPNFKR